MEFSMREYIKLRHSCNEYDIRIKCRTDTVFIDEGSSKLNAIKHWLLVNLGTSENNPKYKIRFYHSKYDDITYVEIKDEIDFIQMKLELGLDLKLER